MVNPKIFLKSWFVCTLYSLFQTLERLSMRTQLQTQGRVTVRVANVVADHDDLITQWLPIKMSKFCANIFLIRTTSNYFWASEVFKNQRFKSHLFSFSQYKKNPKLKTWVDFYAIISFFINKIKKLRQFSENYFSKNGT